MRCILSVLGKDRAGIVAAVSGVLAKEQANIVDISQTILGNIFSMTMIVDLNTQVADFNTVQEALAQVSDDLGVQVVLQREELFDSMYKI